MRVAIAIRCIALLGTAGEQGLGARLGNASATVGRRAALLGHRSVWQTQTLERALGLGLVAISYEPVETLETFSDSRGITFPLISDPGSAIIKRYGLFNESIEPGNRASGVPHPGTLVVDRNGVVTARFFEEAYQKRNTGRSMS